MGKAGVLLLAVLVVAVFGAGCGGDSSDATGSSTDSSAGPSAPPVLPTGGSDGYLSKSELLQAARLICEHVGEENEEDLARFFDERGLDPDEQLSTAQLHELGEEIILPNTHKQTREIINLGPEHRKFEEEADKVLEAYTRAVLKGERDPAMAAAETERLFAEANRLARDFGFTECEKK